MKLSDAMLRVLINLAEGRDARCHLHGQSEYGGFTATHRALVMRGLMTWECEITKQGRAAYAEYRRSLKDELKIDREGSGTGVDCDGRTIKGGA